MSLSLKGTGAKNICQDSPGDPHLPSTVMGPSPEGELKLKPGGIWSHTPEYSLSWRLSWQPKAGPHPLSSELAMMDELGWEEFPEGRTCS